MAQAAARMIAPASGTPVAFGVCFGGANHAVTRSGMAKLGRSTTWSPATFTARAAQLRPMSLSSSGKDGRCAASAWSPMAGTWSSAAPSTPVLLGRTTSMRRVSTGIPCGGRCAFRPPAPASTSAICLASSGGVGRPSPRGRATTLAVVTCGAATPRALEGTTRSSLGGLCGFLPTFPRQGAFFISPSSAAAPTLH